MKKLISTAMLAMMFIASSFTVQATNFVVSNDDDVINPGLFLSLRDGTQVVPLLGQDGIIITSLAATNSANLGQSRINAMAGMMNVNVPDDRNIDPSAWYWIPNTNMAP